MAADHFDSLVDPPVVTLDPEELGPFLIRHRRDRDLECYEAHLDEHLREILRRADDFVPSKCGALLLDDPGAKLNGPTEKSSLAVVASFGPGSLSPGARLSLEHGLVGAVYREGAPHGDGELIGVPVKIGDSICGVLTLEGRRGEASGYSARDLELLGIFAAYISSSIQNAIDALRARELARHDDLTGLYNGRYLHRRLTIELGLAGKLGADLSLLFLDLDHFKQVNDNYGHPAGSRILCEIGRLIANSLPLGAVAARYGGDEFVAILPGADGAEAVAIAQALRRKIAKTPLLVEAFGAEHTGKGIHITASIGVAHHRPHVNSSGTKESKQQTLLQLADSAMYVAKRSGRNRVQIAGREPFLERASRRFLRRWS